MRFMARSFLGLFLLAATLGILAYAGLTVSAAYEERRAEEQRQRPARERVFAANVIAFAPGDVTPVLTSFGEITSRRTLELRATAGGTVVELAGAFEEGGQIKAGDLLLRVDPSDAQSALDGAMTDLTEAQAELRDATAALGLAGEELEAAREQLALQSEVLFRARESFGRRIGTEAAVESAELSEASAKQTVLSRRQALVTAQARVDQANTALARRDLALAEAQRRLNETEIYAEFSGTLSNVTVVKGGLVQNNERIAELVDPAALEVAFRVSTAEYARLLDDAQGLIAADVTVMLDSAGVNLTTTGKISRESPAVGEGQTGRLLFAQISDPKGFRPGDFVTVNVQEPVMRFAMSVPATAVNAASEVLVLGEDDRLMVVPVKVLRSQKDSVIIRSRDLMGKELVTQRSPLLGAGIKVKPLRPTDSREITGPAMVELTEERRAKLVAFVEGNKRMPDEAKKRVLAQLQEKEVPQQMVDRLESRMGG